MDISEKLLSINAEVASQEELLGQIYAALEGKAGGGSGSSSDYIIGEITPTIGDWEGDLIITDVFLPGGRVNGFYMWIKNANNLHLTSGVLRAESSGAFSNDGTYVAVTTSKGTGNYNTITLDGSNIRKCSYDASTKELRLSRITPGGAASALGFVKFPYMYMIW